MAGDSSCHIRGATIKYAWYWIRRESSFCDNQKCMVLNIELGKSSLSSPRTRSGPIASGKTVGLLDTFLIGSLSVYDLLIIIISMIIIMVSTFVFIYDHWSLSSTTMTTQCSLSCQFVVDQYSFSTLLKVKDLKKCWPKVLSRTNNKEVRWCQSTTALASVCDRAPRNTLKPKEKKKMSWVSTNTMVHW